MKVSIITVCLNSERYLQECFNSVRAQSYPDIEYIVVDGRSKDHTLDIIYQNQDIISNFISETDRGMYDAINKGIKLATGDVVGILNSDDMLATPYTVAMIAKCFASTGTDAVYGDLVYIDPQKHNLITRVWKGKAYQRNRFEVGWMPAHPTFYIKRKLIKKYGLYKNHFYSAADYEFMSRYLYKNRCSATYLEDVLIRMRSGGMSNGSLKRRFRANRRDYLAMRENGIPFPFLVSILKPISKLHQYKTSIIDKVRENLKWRTTEVYAGAELAHKQHDQHVDVLQ